MSAIHSNPRVLVFDSGVGSLSIGAEIHALLPWVDLLYVMDRGGFPYGQWQEQPLSDHICKRIAEVLQQHPVDLVVIACNSASTTVLPALRKQLTLPVVGVVPAIKPAAQQSKSKVIGLLATPGTIQRPYTAELIREFASDCCVIQLGSKELAPAIENLYWQGLDSTEVWQHTASELMNHPRANEMDTIVLACTHFPLIKEKLAAEIPGINWIDSGAAIARRVASLLPDLGYAINDNQGQQDALILGENASANLQTTLAAKDIHLLHS